LPSTEVLYILHAGWCGATRWRLAQLQMAGTLLLINFKIQKTTFNTYSKRISVYQKGASNFLVGGLFILIYNVFIPNNDKDLVAIHKLLNFEISFKILFHLLATYVYIIWWLFGLLYFLAYKKSIKELQNRVNLKL
jgi:hypothetical protein